MSIDKLSLEGDGLRDMLDGLKQSISVNENNEATDPEAYAAAIKELKQLVADGNSEYNEILVGLKEIESDGVIDTKQAREMLLQDIEQKRLADLEKEIGSQTIDKKGEKYSDKTTQQLSMEAEAGREQNKAILEAKVGDIITRASNVPLVLSKIMKPIVVFLAKKAGIKIPTS